MAFNFQRIQISNIKIGNKHTVPAPMILHARTFLADRVSVVVIDFVMPHSIPKRGALADRGAPLLLMLLLLSCLSISSWYALTVSSTSTALTLAN